MNNTGRVPIKHLARIRAIQLLYKLELAAPENESLAFELEKAHELAAESSKLRPRELRKIQRIADALVAAVSQRRAELDNTIAQASPKWDTSRMLAVDLATIRLALYEMLHEGVPPPIAINEAVELARAFGDDESWRFTNGILDQIRRDELANLPEKS